MTNIVIVSAVRTPVGSFNGSLGSLPAHELGSTVIKNALESVSLAPAEVSEVIMGQVLTSSAGQNPARQALIHAGLPKEVPAMVVNQVCASGLRAIALGYQAIKSEDGSIVVCGGQESMSQAPHAAHLRNGKKMGNLQFIDTTVHDGLWDAFNDYHMGVTAENIAEKWKITREEQDAFALDSQKKAGKAQDKGLFQKEIVPVTIATRKETLTVNTDEYIRPNTMLASLEKLRPAFAKSGSVTAGNASGINDGAAALVLMTEQEATKRNLTPLARIASWAHYGVEPELMGTGPIPATRIALTKAGWNIQDLDLTEANEAFAAQALCVMKELDLDPDKTNVNGGAIAIGHPIGASGARITVTLLHELVRRKAKKGLATLCVGGGMGIAMCFERL